MKITIVMGFFLPIPPVAGGATEKSWYQLAREFARSGHQVTLISRTWPGFSHNESSESITHLRLKGYNHTPRLWLNLLLDFLWSIRVYFSLPSADVTIVNCIALPILLGLRKGNTGKLAVMPGRIPKGQFRFYRRIDCVLAVSNVVVESILRENPHLKDRITIVGYPIDFSRLSQTTESPKRETLLTIGYVGRIHREKGLDLLIDALALLGSEHPELAWNLILCGPSDVAQGGSGEAYLESIRGKLASFLPNQRFSILKPCFDEGELAACYRQIDLFCYPSLSKKGETFGVAVVEAMAAGAVPVVSRLPCFQDFISPEGNGVVFDESAVGATRDLADRLRLLMIQPERRAALSTNARQTAQRYDFREFSSRLLSLFGQLKP